MKVDQEKKKKKKKENCFNKQTWQKENTENWFVMLADKETCDIWIWKPNNTIDVGLKSGSSSSRLFLFYLFIYLFIYLYYYLFSASIVWPKLPLWHAWHDDRVVLRRHSPHISSTSKVTTANRHTLEYSSASSIHKNDNEMIVIILIHTCLHTLKLGRENSVLISS